jgi:ribosomal protein S25
MAEEKTAKVIADEKALKTAMEEKGQGRAWTKKLDKKYGKTQQIELVDRDPLIPPALEEKLRKTLPYQKVIMLSDLARKNNVRVSTLKALLHILEAEGKVKLFAGSDRLKVYTGVDSDKKPPKEDKGEKGEKVEREKGDKAKAKEEKAKAKKEAKERGKDKESNESKEVKPEETK